MASEGKLVGKQGIHSLGAATPKATQCCRHLACFPLGIKSTGLWFTFGLTCCSVVWMNLLILVLGTAGYGLETGSDHDVPLVQNYPKVTCPAM